MTPPPPPADVDWDFVRDRSSRLGEGAFQFVRAGLTHTTKLVYGQAAKDPQAEQDTRHVTGQQLCMGMRDLALDRYGSLAGMVLRRWGLRATEDFGVIVYALIDRGELRRSDDDSFDDFRAVFDFDEVFSLTVQPKRV